jgi:hypothetical protein
MGEIIIASIFGLAGFILGWKMRWLHEKIKLKKMINGKLKNLR